MDIWTKCRYKNTRVFDPLKSETYRALQEENMGYVDNRVHEVPQPVQTKVFQPNKMVRNSNLNGTTALFDQHLVLSNKTFLAAKPALSPEPSSPQPDGR